MLCSSWGFGFTLHCSSCSLGFTLPYSNWGIVLIFIAAAGAWFYFSLQ
jgi:hypothetical protein